MVLDASMLDCAMVCFKSKVRSCTCVDVCQNLEQKRTSKLIKWLLCTKPIPRCGTYIYIDRGSDEIKTCYDQIM